MARCVRAAHRRTLCDVTVCHLTQIDDDLVYIAPDALRNLVAAKLRSDYLFVSANVANHPLLAHVHQCVP